MKTCPYCHRELPNTAIRCGHCRKPLSAKKRKRIQLKHIDIKPEHPAWSLTEVVVLCCAVFAAIFALTYFEITSSIISILRGKYFILIKEPALQFHLYVFIDTFIVKLSAVAIIWFILRMHKMQFIDGLSLNRPVKRKWLWLFFGFFAFSALSRLLTDVNPLSPNLPIYLFFKESSIVGSLITMISLVIIAPISEEIFFRGFVFPGLNKRLGFYWSVLITSVLFMAIHIPQCKEYPFILFLIFLGGLFLTVVRATTKSTLMVILLHALHNGTIVAVGFIKFLILKY